MVKATLRGMNRCDWCTDDPLYITYHDNEWGVPVHDDRVLFEFLVLEGAQAGLNWLTILKKREGYRKAFAGFDPEQVSQFDLRCIETLMKNSDIVRNRLKIESAINNAKRFLKVQKEYGSFSDYLWGFVGQTPIKNQWANILEVPTKTELSDHIAKDLKKKGFSFVGSTIVYAYMQAVGMVDDHLVDCSAFGTAPISTPKTDEPL